MNLTEAPGGRGPAAAGLTACGTAEHSDAIILFGPTGDLARKKLFPALYDLASVSYTHLTLPTSDLG